jgi:hypothetical protein
MLIAAEEVSDAVLHVGEGPEEKRGKPLMLTLAVDSRAELATALNSEAAKVGNGTKLRDPEVVPFAGHGRLHCWHCVPLMGALLQRRPQSRRSSHPEK